jgi:hypothetical protein
MAGPLICEGTMKQIYWEWRGGEWHPMLRYNRQQSSRRYWLYDKDEREFGWFVKVLTIGAWVLLIGVLIF